MDVFGAVLRRVSPLRGIMSARDYHHVRRQPAMAHGITTVKGSAVRYSDAAGLLHSAKEIFADEVYRFSVDNDTPHIIDAGANIGLSVRYFKHLYPNATIVAYEPDPDIFALLKENVGTIPGVDLRHAAAWVEDTTLTFFTEGSLAGSVELDFLGLAQPQNVPAQRLKTEIAKRPVDFLKIDIEGAENDVLFDIVDELDHVKHLFFEYHSNPGKPQRLGELLELVSNKGFRYVINGAHGPYLPFVETVTNGFDLQLNVSCFRH